VCIISTAQQANPKVIGHIEPVRAQFINASTLESTYSAPCPLLERPRLELAVGSSDAKAGTVLCNSLVVDSLAAAAAALGSSDMAIADLLLSFRARVSSNVARVQCERREMGRAAHRILN
jgi:hypothetical protein